MAHCDFVRAEIDGQIGRLTFANASKHNALPQKGWEAIPLSVNQLVRDGARVIIVSGQGRSFCAGADIAEFDVVRSDAKTARIYEQTNIDAFSALRNAPVPVIAQISGYCLGGGFGLAAACDLRYGDLTAEFSIPPAKLGLAYPAESMIDLVTALGEQVAKAMLFTARRCSAQDMSDAGFLLSLEDEESLPQKVQDLAETIADLAPLTHEASKATIAATVNGIGLGAAKSLGDATFESADYAEGRAAFREKRKARFEGR